eukprot:4005774-Lingulodinium_polyedra.AAC.1
MCGRPLRGRRPPAQPARAGGPVGRRRPRRCRPPGATLPAQQAAQRRAVARGRRPGPPARGPAASGRWGAALCAPGPRAAVRGGPRRRTQAPPRAGPRPAADTARTDAPGPHPPAHSGGRGRGR